MAVDEDFWQDGPALPRDGGGPSQPDAQRSGAAKEAKAGGSQQQVEVVLNVYEDNPENQCRDFVLSTLYGGFSYFENGAVRLTPRRMPLFELVREISLGQVVVDDQYVVEVLSHLENEFSAHKFDWSLRNSMHFTGQMAHMLLNGRAPPWIVQMADCGKLQLPKRVVKDEGLSSSCLPECPCVNDANAGGPVPYDFHHAPQADEPERQSSVRWSSLERHLIGEANDQDEVDDEDLPQLLNHETAAARSITSLKYPTTKPRHSSPVPQQNGRGARQKPAQATKPSPLVAYLHRGFAEQSDANRSPYDTPADENVI